MRQILICFLFLVTTVNVGLAQDIKVTLGPDEIGENQVWTITATINNDRLKSYDNFPDLDGFRKRGTSTQSTTNIVNGQISSSQSVVMNYAPLKQGTFTIPAFSMKVNGVKIDVPGKKVKVGPPIQVQQRDPLRSFLERDPAQDFFGRSDTEFIDVKEDAFFALTTSKDEVYVGEGFTATLSFFVSEDNRAPLQFHELGKQLSDIMKKIRPANCWEENFNIENIEGQSVNIQGKPYTQYKIYQGAFYPLNAEPVVFPSVGLEMIKYKVAKNPSFFGQNRKEDFKTFYTRKKEVKVKDLPPHPLKDAVAVGQYQLDERLRDTDLETGMSVPYEFRIYGEGNISAINKPTVLKDGNFELYEPNVSQGINRDNNRVTGTKSFSYFMIPREPGKYNLGDYFQWVFFNPATRQYDTLKSQLTAYVTGESKKNEAIQSTDPGAFYNKMNDASNTLAVRGNLHWQRWGFNIFILVMLGASVYLVVKK